MTPIEPVGLNELFAGVMAGALIVLFGALYAALFAFARLFRKRRMMVIAYGFFGLLAASVLALAGALNMSGFWDLLIILLLVGYLVAPHLIWRLAEGTHAGQDDETSAGRATGKNTT